MCGFGANAATDFIEYSNWSPRSGMLPWSWRFATYIPVAATGKCMSKMSSHMHVDWRVGQRKMWLSPWKNDRGAGERYLKLTEQTTAQPLILELVRKEGTSPPRKDDGQWNDYHIVAPALLIVRNICEFCSHITYFQSLFLDIFLQEKKSHF